MKILIADDSATPRQMLKRELTGLGHECLVAENGEQAWKMFQSSGVDVVISDWMMPGMDGDEFCRRVRSDPDAPYPYFILLTSLDDRRHVVEGMQAGADDYLTKPFGDDELATRLIAAERVTGLHRQLAVQQAELARLNSSLYDDSRSDTLTSLGNRRRMDEDLDMLAGQAERSGNSLAVALFDVDRFKQYNDTAGHQAGDEVLRAVAAALVGQARRGDAVYRYGGEELLVMFPAQDLDGAVIGAERMRAAVEALAISHPGLEPDGIVTISSGVARLRIENGGERVEQLLERADAALYEAKEAGRNRVVVESPQTS
jgi:two-component system cell cycle response regulator